MGDYILLTTVLSGIFLIMVIWRILYPFKCTCGYRTWFAHAFLRHLATKHAYEK
jgi:hypothetical protein